MVSASFTTLVLAGALGMDRDEAEEMKRDPEQERTVFAVVKPTVEKMASIVKKYVDMHPVDTIYVVGGACSFTDFEATFQKFIGVECIKPAAPLLVTPLGIAYGCGN